MRNFKFLKIFCLKVQKKDSEGVHFWIVPTSVGLIPIEVKASAGKVVDIIRMDLLVKVLEDLKTKFEDKLLMFEVLI